VMLSTTKYSSGPRSGRSLRPIGAESEDGNFVTHGRL
jgi:hypothetical protein